MINKAVLVGRVGGEPESKYTPQGSHVISFSVATNKKWKDQSGQQHESTEWHNVVAWNKIADIIQKYVHKGDLVYVEGSLETQSWEKEGTKFYKTQVNCQELKMLGGKKENAKPHVPQHANNSFVSDEVPF
jgi:single-strand DNA-binding protein